MIDKELKSKIADIIMEAIEEYNSNEMNRPMIASVYAGEIISFINSLPEEPISEDLEEAAKEYAKCQREDDLECGYDLTKLESFISGAQWREEQFEKNRLEHCNSITNDQAELEQKFLDEHLDKYNRMPTFLDAIEYGMRLQKEQLMKNAVECEYFDGSLFRNDFREKYRDCDKVKIVIVKSE